MSYREPVKIESSFQEKIKQAVNEAELLKKQKEVLLKQEEQLKEDLVLQEKRTRISLLEKMVQEVLPSIPDLLRTKDFIEYKKVTLPFSHCNKFGQMRASWFNKPFIILSLINAKLFDTGLECDYEECHGYFKWYDLLRHNKSRLLTFYLSLRKEERYGLQSFVCNQCHNFRVARWGSVNFDKKICDICQYESKSTPL
jgi:hypothetical protein